MRSKDFVLQHFPRAKIAVRTIKRRHKRSIKEYVVCANGFAFGFGDTESSAWVDAKKWLKQYGTNPEKW